MVMKDWVIDNWFILMSLISIVLILLSLINGMKY